MATNIPFQTDLRVNVLDAARTKMTLNISETGDLQLIDGKEKLSAQLLRAVINDEIVLGELANRFPGSTRRIQTLFNLIMRNFRTNQINDVKKSDSNFSGFSIFRKRTGSTDEYIRVSTEAITHKFIDTELINGTSYDYGITKFFNNVFETNFTDKFTIAPSQFTRNQEIIISGRTAAFSENEQITIYVDYNKKYRGSEILDEIISITARQQDNEPRQWFVDIIVKDVRGNNLSISSNTYNITT
jgi:hypothetical protein